MELNGAALAMHLANGGQVGFFAEIASKLRAKEDTRWRPPGFPRKANAQEIFQFVIACAELLEKWGRRFQNAPPPLTFFVDARQTLISSGGLPGPDQYVYVDPNIDPMESSGDGRQRSQLDQEALNSMVRNFQTLQIQYGSAHFATQDAKQQCQEELKRWQEASQAAADQGDFGEFEKLASVVHRCASQLESSDVSAAAGAPTALQPSHAQDDMDERRERRRHKHRHKSPGAMRPEVEDFPGPSLPNHDTFPC
jgi:hypothetical protein